ncbi:substrate-binding domain-containing protein [Streptomyces sp. SP17BM10]|uniref:sugar ABC transporter substrate-binding protein n=1 Tax=Streptomyces sp. SP17BM10 TaxID=3002530 RepID=UPI002E774071|nr:substrate-binding domain-containing protein [Streptomyces sp. SP17BM10]MEE1785476.1 substrate-binding domain-containing protein [Streptomyces sp. SP17BM10]
MNRAMRLAATGTAAVSLALTLAACGQTGAVQKPASGGSGEAIGLLLPDNTSSTRYDAFDKPLIQQTVTGLCGQCTLDYANAGGDAAAQKKQFDDLVAKGVKVILLDPVDAKVTGPWVDAANAKGIKVVSYDRLAQGKVAAYVSFDNERTGELQGQSLLDALGPKASSANVVMIDGAESDPNAAQFKAGAHRAMDGKVKKIAYEQSGEWKTDVATAKINEAIQSLGKDGIQAVYAGNDGMAGAVIDALKAAGIKNVPVGGQDASIDAVRRVLTGEQAYTIYKPYKPETDAAGSIAVQLAEGMDITTTATTLTSSNGLQIPSLLLTPIVVTKAKVQATVVGGGLYKAADICTQQFAAACAAAGVQ